MKDLARKIDSMRQFGYVLLTPKEAKRVAIELRRVERMKRRMQKEIDAAKNRGWSDGWNYCMEHGPK